MNKADRLPPMRWVWWLGAKWHRARLYADGIATFVCMGYTEGKPIEEVRTVLPPKSEACRRCR